MVVKNNILLYWTFAAYRYKYNITRGITLQLRDTSILCIPHPSTLRPPTSQSYRNPYDRYTYYTILYLIFVGPRHNACSLAEQSLELLLYIVLNNTRTSVLLAATNFGLLRIQLDGKKKLERKASDSNWSIVVRCYIIVVQYFHLLGKHIMRVRRRTFIVLYNDDRSTAFDDGTYTYMYYFGVLSRSRLFIWKYRRCPIAS